ncbi:MAG: ATP synthase F1 subunit epsilon [Bdellovibrionia bacterium]
MFKLTIVTPEKRILLNQDVEEVTLPGFKGELNILSGHSPLITTLETGVLKWKVPGKEIQEQAAISWGYCHVSPEGVNVLADIAKLSTEIDLSVATQTIGTLESKLGSDSLTDEEWAQIQRDLALARASVEAVPATQKH